MRTLFAAALLAAPVAAQQTITQTRVFDGEVLDACLGGIPSLLGVSPEPNLSDGVPVWVSIDLEVRWEFAIDCTNNTGVIGGFYYEDPLMAYLPVGGDCAAYALRWLGGMTGSVDPGQSAIMAIDLTHQVQWSGSDFQIGCNDYQWPWWRLEVNTVNFLPTFFGPDGFPTGDFVTLLGRATVTGTVTTEWAPNELPHWNVCDGNSVTPTTLTPVADWERLWLAQTGVPSDGFNLLIRNTTASNVVPPNGLCVTQGGGAFSRITESLSLGGEPFYLGLDPVLSGTVHYFQSWFRTDTGPQTGECIGVSVP